MNINFQALTKGKVRDFAILVDGKHLTSFLGDTRKSPAAFLKDAEKAAKQHESKIRGQRLRDWRENQGLSIREAAEEYGIAYSYVSDLERGTKSWGPVAQRYEEATAGVWGGL